MPYTPVAPESVAKHDTLKTFEDVWDNLPDDTRESYFAYRANDGLVFEGKKIPLLKWREKVFISVTRLLGLCQSRTSKWKQLLKDCGCTVVLIEDESFPQGKVYVVDAINAAHVVKFYRNNNPDFVDFFKDNVFPLLSQGYGELE